MSCSLRRTFFFRRLSSFVAALFSEGPPSFYTIGGNVAKAARGDATFPSKMQGPGNSFSGALQGLLLSAGALTEAHEERGDLRAAGGGGGVQTCATSLQEADGHCPPHHRKGPVGNQRAVGESIQVRRSGGTACLTVEHGRQLFTQREARSYTPDLLQSLFLKFLVRKRCPIPACAILAVGFRPIISRICRAAEVLLAAVADPLPTAGSQQ